MSKWSDFLRANMQRKSWDGAQLARAADVTPSAISRWLSGGTRPTFDRVRQIADAFDVPIITALLAAEIITPEEAGVKTTIVDIKTVDTADILREMGARLGYRTTIDSTDATVLQGRWGDSSVPPPSLDEPGVAADADDE